MYQITFLMCHCLPIIYFLRNQDSQHLVNGLISQQDGNVSWQRESAQKRLNTTSGAQFAALPLIKPVVWFAILLSTDVPVLLLNQPNIKKTTTTTMIPSLICVDIKCMHLRKFYLKLDSLTHSYDKNGTLCSRFNWNS